MLERNRNPASGPAAVQRAADNLPGTHRDRAESRCSKNGYEPIPIKRGTKYPEYHVDV